MAEGAEAAPEGEDSVPLARLADRSGTVYAPNFSAQVVPPQPQPSMDLQRRQARRQAYLDQARNTTG
jgi:hypothetical protein